MKARFLSTRMAVVAFGSAFAILLVVAGFSYRSIVASNDSDRWVKHTHDVLDNLEELRFAMETVALSLGGYVLTGDERSLERYRVARSSLEQHTEALRTLTLDNPEQQRRIPILQRLATERLEHAEETIDLRRTWGLQPAAESARTGPGQPLVVEYQALVRQMQDEEHRLLVLRNADTQQDTSRTEIILILGTVLGLLITAVAGWSVYRDSLQRAIAERVLFAEKERAQVTLNSIGDAVACTDISGNLTYLNVVGEHMTGWSQQEAAGRPMDEVLRISDEKSRQPIPNPMESAIARDQIFHLPANCILTRRDGFEFPIEDSVAPIHDHAGQITGAVIVFRDVSASRAMVLEMTHSAEHDLLTGLPNRLLLNDRISQAIALAPLHLNQVAVLFLDLDGFKHVNDSLGHSAGDKLVQSVAKRLADCVRDSDTVSRQGGDEFVVLLSALERGEDTSTTARKMLRAVAEPHSIAGRDLHITASIGISVYPDDGQDAETLIKNADTAMYEAKGNGRQRFQFFKSAMNVQAVERQFIEESLRAGLERHEFAVHYQPKINLRTGAITGAEALLRWTHPTRGPVSPGEFIPVAEDCGLILPLGAWVLREACAQARAWINAGLPLASIAVNVSAMQFQNEDFLEDLFKVLQETGLDPTQLEIELTESVLMKRAGATALILQAVREKGVRVSIDDFGTGYSSLSYLRKFPVDALKIDQSFVRQIGVADDETTIVSAVIGMARGLKLRVIAEGVETVEQLAFLRAHRCDEAQGFYFSRPVPPQEFTSLLEFGLSQSAAARRSRAAS
jgi:diguanylate cyclase (GGDEF)-like protein/PAS domain S-box-containing protein